MRTFDEMRQFMKNNIIQAFNRLACKLCVEPYVITFDVTATPLCFHALYDQGASFYTKCNLPS